MGYRKLTSEQARVVVNAQALFTQYEAHRIDSGKVAGSMHWKTINGTQYLYRAFSHGRNTSLGRRCSSTEALMLRFKSQQQEYKERDAQLREQISIHAGYIRVNGLNRFPVTGARVIRALQKQNIPYRLIGTNALYAYEARASSVIMPEHLATNDVDILMDARQGIRIAANLKRRTLLDVVKDSDKSFRRVSASEHEFSAANNNGYRVDFVTQGGHQLKPNEFDAILEQGDLMPVAIDSLKWHVAAPNFEAITFDDRGMPLRLRTVDPRAFVLHKWFVSQQPDRNSLKRNRDEDQARLIATLIRREMTDLSPSKAIQKIFPNFVSRQATDAMDDFDL